MKTGENLLRKTSARRPLLREGATGNGGGVTEKNVKSRNQDSFQILNKITKIIH